MRKNILKTFVIVNTIALGLVGAIGSNEAKAASSSYPIYSNGKEIVMKDKNTFYLNDSHDYIDIELGSGLYDVTLGDITISRVGGTIRNLDVSRLKDGVYSLEIDKIGSSSKPEIYNVVIDTEAPEFSANLELNDRDLENGRYNGGSLTVYVSKIEGGNDIDHLEAGFMNDQDHFVSLDDRLDLDLTDFRLSSSDMSEMGTGNYDIVLAAFDKAGNMSRTSRSDVTVKIDYDEGRNKDDATRNNVIEELNRDLAYVEFSNGTILNHNDYISSTVSGSKVKLYFDNDSNGVYAIDPALDKNFSSVGYFEVTPAQLQSGVTIYGRHNNITGQNKYTTSITFKLGNETINEITGSYDSKTIKGGKVVNSSSEGIIKKHSEQSTTTISGMFQDTITLFGDIVEYKVGEGSYIKGGIQDLNAALRKMTGTKAVSVITHGGKELTGDATPKITITESTIKVIPGANAEITIGEDMNPQIGFNIPIEITYDPTISGSTLDAVEVYVNGKLIDSDQYTVTDLSSSSKKKINFNYRTSGVETLNLEVELRGYEAASGHTGAIENVYSIKASDKIDENGMIYANVDYVMAGKDSVKVSVTVFDQDNKLREAKVTLYDRKEPVGEPLYVGAGTTVHTFEDLPSNGSYTVKVEGEYRGVSYGDLASLLNGEDAGNIKEDKDYTPRVPYTNDINADTLGNLDNVQVYDYSIDYDYKHNDLELKLYYNVLDENVTDRLRVRVSQFDPVKGEFVDLDKLSKDGKDAYDNRIDITKKTGKSSSSIVIEGDNLVDEKIREDRMYRVEVEDGGTTIAFFNFYPQNSKPIYDLKPTFFGESSAEFMVTNEKSDTKVSRVTLYIYEARDDDYNDYVYKQDVTKDKTEVKVSGLRKNTEYIAELRADYTTGNDVHMSNDFLTRINFTTGQVNPVVRLSNVTSSGSSIYFDYTLEDPANTIVDAKAQLYTNGRKVEGQAVNLYAGSETREAFDNIDQDKEYEIKVELKYTSNITGQELTTDNYTNPDGTSTSVKVYASKMVPVAEAEVKVDFDKISIKGTLKDEYNAMTGASVKLFKEGKGSPVYSKAITKGEFDVTFDKLEPSTTYTIKVDVQYRPSHSAQPKTISIFAKDLTTLKEVDARFDNIKEASDAITADIYVTNNKGYDIFAEIRQGDTTLGKKQLTVGNNKISFTGLEQNRSYEILTYSINDKGEKAILNRELVKSVPETIVQKPTFEIISVKPDGKTLNIVVNVSDPDSVIKPQVVTVTIKDPSGEEVVKKVALREIKENDGILSITLPFDQNEVKVAVNYENANQEVVEIYQTIDYSVESSSSSSNYVTYGVIAALSVAVIVMGGVLIFRKRH